MTPETFIEHFETLAEAPNGIEKLRELVLQLAVQGKLGTQDENDEPVKELLHRLELRRASPHVAEVSSPSSEASFAGLPPGWDVVALNEIANIVYGKNLPTANLKPDGYPVFGANGVIGCYDRFLYETPQLLISCRGAYSGKINMSPPKAFITNNSLVVELFTGLESAREYLFHALAAIDRSAMITGTAQPQVTVANAIQLRIPFPPLAEQRRIVGKVDQLLGLCDELAARQAARREARSALVGAALDRLVSARSSAESPSHAHRLRDHFDRLFDTPTTIPQLRQAILQLAVQGQLVPQDPNDEPATVLLAKVKAERERRVVAKEIPNQKAVPPVSPKEWLFNLPLGWTWARFGDLCLFIEAGLSPTCEGRPRTENEWGVLKISAVTWGTFNPDENKALPSNIEPHRECEVRPGDFLMTRANTAELVAKSVVVETTPPRLLLNDKTLRVVFPDSVNRRYVNVFNNGSIAREHYMRVASGTSESMRNVSRDSILAMPIPVPPLAEQKRIVSKVTELLSLCDALEAKLTQAESASTQLLYTAVHHLLNVSSKTV